MSHLQTVSEVNETNERAFGSPHYYIYNKREQNQVNKKY